MHAPHDGETTKAHQRSWISSELTYSDPTEIEDSAIAIWSSKRRQKCKIEDERCLSKGLYRVSICKLAGLALVDHTNLNDAFLHSSNKLRSDSKKSALTIWGYLPADQFKSDAAWLSRYGIKR